MLLPSAATSAATSAVGSAWLGVRRAVLIRRRSLAALLTALAVLTGLQVLRAPEPPEVTVLTAAKDLPAGTVLDGDDLTSHGFDPDDVPQGLVEDPTGRTLAGGVRRGEPITDTRLVGPSLSTPERVAVPLRLPDAGMAALLRVGMRIDLVATDPRSGEAHQVAFGVPVLALPQTGETGGLTSPTGSESGALVVLGIEPTQVETVTASAAGEFLTYAFTR